MKHLYLALALLTLPFGSRASEPETSAVTAKPVRFEIGQIMLLQPDWLIEQRVTAPELSKTIGAVKQLIPAWAAQLSAEQDPNQCNVFVALRHQKRIRTWTACNGFQGSSLDSWLAKKLKPNDIADVRDLVVLSIHGSALSKEFPQEWRTVSKGESLEIGALVDLAWPQ